jgi:hypothetical protein
MIPRWGRSFAIVTAVAFSISLIFPLGAGLSRNTATFPKWWGTLDVSLAFILAALVLVIFAVTQGKVSKPAEDRSYRTYRILIHGIFVLLVLFFVLGNRIVWNNCLTGFAWRAWLLLYALPNWVQLLSPRNYLG